MYVSKASKIHSKCIQIVLQMTKEKPSALEISRVKLEKKNVSKAFEIY